MDKNKQNNHVSNLKWENKIKFCKTCNQTNENNRFCLIDQCAYCYGIEHRRKNKKPKKTLYPKCDGCQKSRNDVIMQTARFCRSCYNKQYYKNNIEKEASRHKKYYNNNKEYCAKRHRKYRSNPVVIQRMKDTKKEWRKLNRGYELQQKAENRKNPGYIERENKRRKIRYKNDIQYNLNARVRTALNQCLKNKNGQKSEKLLGYSRTSLLSHLKTTFKNGMSWDDYLCGKIHVDHIIPIVSFEIRSFDSEAFKLCWSLKNLRFEWGNQNQIKNDILPNKFRARDLIYKIKNQDDYDRVLNGGFPLADLTNYNCEI